MTTWRVESGNILDLSGDVLVCSANPFLTLSGGVGGAFLQRYGSAMQVFLSDYLQERAMRHVPPGTVVKAPPCGSPYHAVLHAVAVDASYDSTPATVTAVASRALAIAAELTADVVLLPALATGYGKLTKLEFANGLRPLVVRGHGVPRVVICTRNPDDAVLIRHILGLT